MMTTTTMTTRKWATAAAITAVALALGAPGLTKLLGGDPIGREYPEVPFERVPESFPRIIHDREPPDPGDKAALDAYRAARKVVREYLSKDGAIAHARADEREAVTAALDWHFPKAKSLALKVLGADSGSVPALHALALARVEGDANLPDGLFLVRRARKLIERRGLQNPRDNDAREWYLRTLDLEHDILTALARSEEAIRVVERMESIYGPLPHAKVWSYFKLNRLDEAEKAIRQEEKSGLYPRTSLNDRMALLEQRHLRRECYELSTKAVAGAKDSAVIRSNQAGSALCDFRLDEAETSYREAAAICDRKGKPDFSGTPYTPLAQLYIQEGRFAEALESLKKAKVHRGLREPSTLQNDQGRYDIATGNVLLALGRTGDAERFVRRSVETPERLGSTSTRRDDQVLGNAIALWTALEASRQRSREGAAARGPMPWPAVPSRAAAAIEAELWTLAHQVGRLARDPERPNILRPYAPGSASVETWELGSVLRLVPSGVGLAMVAQARREEHHPAAPPYFDALEAEARLLAGEAETALRLGRQALDKLPTPAESALRGRTAAVAAEAARRLGRTDESRTLWGQALAEFPAAPLLLGLAVPVKLDDDGSPAARALVTRLGRSPRLRAESWGLRLRIASGNGSLTAALLRSDGSSHAEARVALKGDLDDATLTAAFERFHDRLYAPSIELAAADVNALDGIPSLLAGRRRTDAVLAQIRPGAVPAPAKP